jgi:uncharacterized protein (TIGR02246 family)
MSNDETTIAEITRLDAERITATLGKDAAKLNQLFADDMRYVHSSATEETKAMLIERATTGFYDYKALTSLKRDFRVLGPDTVLAEGDIKIELLLKGQPKTVLSRYLGVWSKRGGKWQIAAWHSTPIPG